MRNDEINNLRRLFESRETFDLALEMCAGLGESIDSVFPEFSDTVTRMINNYWSFDFVGVDVGWTIIRTHFFYCLFFADKLEIESCLNFKGIDFSLFRELNYLRFEACKLSDPIFKMLEKCERLEWLHFYNCGLKSLPDLSNLKLTRLNLWMNNLEQLPALPLTIERLTLSYNYFDNVPDLSYLPNLKHLSMSNNKISSLPEWVLNKCDWDDLTFINCMFPEKFYMPNGQQQKLLNNNPRMRYDFSGCYGKESF